MALRDILTCGARSAAAFAVAAGIATGTLAQGYVTDGLVTKRLSQSVGRSCRWLM